MKPVRLFLLCVVLMTSYSCHKQDKEIEVRLSLFDECYVKMELTNYTNEDLYIPHMDSFISVWDEKGIEVTNAYLSCYCGGGGSNFDVLVNFGPPDKKYTDENYDAQQRIYYDEALKTEKENFLKLNSSVTEEMIDEEYGLSFDDFLGLLYMYNKYDGIAIKAGQTLHVFEPIFGLFVDNGDRLTIRFTRHNDSEFSVSDIVNMEGCRFYSSLPEVNAGYRLYDGVIACDDVITLNP